MSKFLEITVNILVLNFKIRVMRKTGLFILSLLLFATAIGLVSCEEDDRVEYKIKL
jgi:hypothetical protein